MLTDGMGMLLVPSREQRRVRRLGTVGVDEHVGVDHRARRVVRPGAGEQRMESLQRYRAHAIVGESPQELDARIQEPGDASRVSVVGAPEHDLRHRASRRCRQFERPGHRRRHVDPSGRLQRDVDRGQQAVLGRELEERAPAVGVGGQWSVRIVAAAPP